ncbi:hypothetical protein CB0940_00304 [Cercospora beticola]|uniref:Uncharacterized protein n=1 Tax=Cercospora beticola TaxID=122368 RepID=A0A2G5I9E5_CERBT|nr:hypothetical protein CB0940_00304 [Cercospora beticola]PIB01399.1 hypothetical protein CB0940_00304 [Cercospora beticola]
MSNSDIEKGAGASTYVQQPQAAHVEHSTSFLPTYEEHLNENLRKFGQPDGQDNAKAFDLIEEPKAGRRKCMKREYLILAIIFFLICAIALPLGLVFIIRNHHSDQEVREINSTTSTSVQTKTDFVSLQPSTLQTRQAESTSSSITPVTAVLTSTVVPVTVYVTMTPTPEASTPTITVTRTQSLSTSKPETTATSDASTATVTTLSIVTATPSTSTSTSSTSTLSKFVLNPALIPSIQSELAEASSSRAAEETKATATTKKETTTATVVSATTIEPPTTASKAMQTAHPRFGFCGVAGSNC